MILALALAVAQTGELPRLEARTSESTPTIDGILAPGEWADASSLELRYQIDPGDNTAPSERTEVLVMRSAEYLYFAFHAHDSDPGALRARVARRDDIFDDDYVALYLDTYDDRQRAYALFFNPLGIQADGIYSESTAGLASRRYEDSVDLSWDGILESKGAVGEDGYVVEAAIPFKTIRFASGEGQLWGLHVQRRIPRRAERDSWTPLRRDVSGLLVQMGSLGGLDDIFSGRTLDLIPTLTLSRAGEREPVRGLDYVARLEPGLTASWALAPHAVLSATANPDFSQVESDVPQIVVNQRFPLFYPEKRPFFLEGAELFLPAQTSGAAINLVDTRTIVDPDWGMKFTGKLGHTAIGLLTASDQAPGLRLMPGDPGYGRNAQVTIARLRQDVSEDSAVGLFINDWQFAGASNTVVEGDGRLRLSESNTFAFQAGGSRTRDADGERTNGAFSLARLIYDGRHWKTIVADKRIGEGYLNEAGFVRRTGIRSETTRVTYDYRPEGSTWLVALQPYFLGSYARNAEGFLDESYYGQGLDVVFPDGISASCFTLFEREHFTLTDVNNNEVQVPLTYRFYNVGAEVERFKVVSFSVYVQFGDAVNYDPDHLVVGNTLQISADATVKPNDRLSSEFLYLKARLSDRRTDERLYSQDIYRNRTVYQFTRSAAARAIIEYDTFLRQLSTSLLLSYTPHPNTAVYIGYGEVGSTVPDPLTGARAPGYSVIRNTLFTKVSYNIRF